MALFNNGQLARLESEIGEVRGELETERNNAELLHEALAELTMDDQGWRRMASGIADDFTDSGRQEIISLCRYMVVANPLIKRGVLIRIGYIWGQGLEVQVPSEKDGKKSSTQDVNQVIQDFWDDNVASLSGSQAQEELERALGTNGEIYLAAFTSPLTGRVRVRSIISNEILQIVSNPDDQDDPQFYVREYTRQDYQANTSGVSLKSETIREVHPALGFRPRVRPKEFEGHPILWDAPILHVPVNRLDGWQRGVPDVYAAIAWARLYRDFLVDWAGLTKSLSKLAWKATGDTKTRAQTAATKAQALANVQPVVNGTDSGQAVVMGPGNTFEAVSKSGATIDSQSGKPLAGMVAAGIGIPLTMLLADPGITGARATAETLDDPTILEMTMRRLLWQSKLTELFDYVIDQNAIAPKGKLKGTMTVDDWDRRCVKLAGDPERTVAFEWPKLTDIEPVAFINAVVAADGTGKLPPLETLKLLLNALGVKDIDTVIDDVTDENGDYIEPLMTAGQSAADNFRKGKGPGTNMAAQDPVGAGN